MRKVKRIINLVIVIIMLWASMLSVQASSFEFDAIAHKEEVNAGDIVKIDMKVTGIDAREGINVVEGNLEFDETMFESVAIKNMNGWTTTYCAEEGEKKGKFVIVKLVEGVTQEETIGQIQLKLKNNLEAIETQIKIKRAISNDGIELMNEGNRTVKIKILKRENGSQNGNLNGGQNGSQNGNLNGGQNGGQNGNVNGEQNGEKNENANGEQNGEQNGNSNGIGNGSQNGNSNSGQNGNQEGKITSKESITGDNIKTGDSIVLIVIVVIVLIGINLIFFVIKGKQLETEGAKERYRKRMLILVTVSILLMTIVIFLAKDIVAFEEEEIKVMIQQLKNQNKDNPDSEEYMVTDEIISRVKPETTIEMLKSKVENVEIIDGEDKSNVKTGMVAKYGENGRIYEISVLGDINGDGILNQIDLTREIRESIKSEKWRIEKEVEKISADVNFDKEINEKDIRMIINYILYGELHVKEVERVIAPKTEVISGLEVEEGRYLSTVTVRITQQNEETKTAKTTYEITGTKTTQEKEINNKQEEVLVAEAGVYKITSYTYGIDGNKSKGSDVIVVIEAPDVKINTEEWTNQNITVTIEGKEGYEIEYKIGDGEWKKYDKEFEIEENCEITTRLKKDDIYGVEVKKEITNIDKEKPTGKMQVTSLGSGRIVLAVEGQDERLSGIKEIRVYAKEQTATQYECKATYDYEEDENKNDLKQESFVLKGLDAATAYDIYIEVEDRAGNIFNKDNTERNENTSISETTKEMATPVLVTTPVGWTNENVEVAIEAEEEYQIEYKINNDDWTLYTGKFEVEQNCIITAKLTEDGSVKNVSEATTEITNIDKLAPNPFVPVVDSITTNSISITGSTIDQDGTEMNGNSGIEKYYFSKDDGKTWEPTEGQTETTYIFEDLTQGTTYNLKMKAVDRAGNETIADTITKETDKVPDLTDSDTSFTYSTTNPTNKDVIVTIMTTARSGYTLQYSKDKANWYDYETAVSMSQNGDIYARLRDSTGQIGGMKKGNVSNIDKLPPNIFTPTATTTTNRITIKGGTTDQSETEAYASSGIGKYYFSKDDGETWEPTEGQQETSYTFSGLIQNTTYPLRIKAVDNAGNETITNTITKTTGSLPNLTEGNTTFSYSTTSITNQDVIVTIQTTETNGILQYSTDATNWTDYTTPVEMTQNGYIYTRMWDGTNAGESTHGRVENIDKLAPNNFTPTATSTTNKIIVTGSTTDQEATDAYASSGLDRYYFSKDNGTTWEPTAGQIDTSYTFSNLKQNTNYNLKMKAIDKVGNERITSTVTKATGSVPTLAEANIRMLPDKSLPTTENVIVTIGNSNEDEYRVLYAINNPENEDSWSEYTTPITMTQNGAVYARLIDSVGNVGGYATLNITNIDRLPPNEFTTSTLTATSTKNSITVTANATDPKDENGFAGSGIEAYNFSINNGAWKGWQTSGQYTFNGLTTGTYTIRVKVKDRVGHEVEGSMTQEVIDLSLSSTSGRVISGNSVNITVNGGNYGTLSCSSNNTSVATATLSGNTLTVRGVSTANGTQSATITVRGSKGGTATYTIQSHKHYGSESSGGGCYGSQNTGTRTCTGTRTGVSCGGTISAVMCLGNITANTSTCGQSISYNMEVSMYKPSAGTWRGTITGTCPSHGTIVTGYTGIYSNPGRKRV